MSEKMNKVETQEVTESGGIRVNLETKKKAHELLKVANKKARGRKIKMPDLIVTYVSKRTRAGTGTCHREGCSAPTALIMDQARRNGSMEDSLR